MTAVLDWAATVHGWQLLAAMAVSAVVVFALLELGARVTRHAARHALRTHPHARRYCGGPTGAPRPTGRHRR
jgi:hypothetical protein